MGCVSSVVDNTAESSFDRNRQTSDQGDAKPQCSVSSISNDCKTATSTQVVYDTELSASVVENNASTVAYHGLLLDSGKLSLKRSATLGGSKIFVKSVHPSDDAYSTESSSEPSQTGITTLRGIAMTMPYTIMVAASDAGEDIKNIAARIFDNANRTVNGWNPESEISKLNGMPPGKPLQVSSELLDLFDIIDRMNFVTEGRFDPTTGALIVAFENCIKSNARPPLPSEIKPLKYGIGWQKRLERKGTKATRTNGNTVIDLDGISKGFVIDRIVEALLKNGYRSCYVDWAGDICAIGNHPSGRPWRSAVLIPPPLRRMFTHWQTGTLKEMLQSDDIGFFANYSFHPTGNGGAIATSGDYFSIQQYGYHHIASSEDLTVMKASQTSVASVCVAAGTCAAADAIATAAMTYKTVEETIGFLKRIQSGTRDIISGFCVMSRDQSNVCSPDTYTSNIFVSTLETDSSTTDTKTMDSRSNSAVSENAMSNCRKRVTRNVAQIHFKGIWIVSDSFTPCSMEPEQLITFISPTSFVSGASVDPANDLNRLFAVILGFQSENSDETHQSVRIDMRFRKVVEYGKNVLVVAAIEAVDLGSMSVIEIPFREGISARRNMKLSIPRSRFGISPLLSQAKEILRQIPAVVWILGTKSADQVELAITATSVTVPQFLESMLCFNIAHSSTFFAGIGGLGSRIRGHALSVLQKRLAATFVTRSGLDLDAISSLESDSVMTVDCTVELVETVQDHIVVLAHIDDIRYADRNRAPLLWLQGGYLQS